MAAKKGQSKTQTNTSKATKAPTSMEELLSRTGFQIKSFHEGDEIEAIVTDIQPQVLMFNIGGKSEGILTGPMLDEVYDMARSLKLGDKVKATVVDAETREGYVRLSLKQYAAKAQWDEFKKARDMGTIVIAVVKSVSDKGLVVSLSGLMGFVPTAQVGKDTLAKGEELVEKEVSLKVIELDPKRGRVVFSEKAVSEAGQLELEAKAISKLKPGEVLEGEVTQLTNFGAFIRLSVNVSKKQVFIEGLVHVSEISWEKVEKAENRLSVGDKVQVKVLEVGKGRVALSIKQAKKDPWDEAGSKYKPESKHTGKVVKQSNFGVFIELEPGIEGLLHITKIPPTYEFKKGQDVQVYIEEVHVPERKIALGLVLTTKPVAYK